MAGLSFRKPLLGAGAALAAVTVLGTIVLTIIPSTTSRSNSPANAVPAATPASVAVVEPRETNYWDEFSGRLEAVERVEVRSRVAGAVQAVHFREGALVNVGDRLITIDPAPYQAEVDRADAQVVAAQARLALTKNDYERGQQLWGSRTVSERDLDQRINAYHEAEANLRAAQAALQSAKLNLGYTEVVAPVSGRVGKIEITVGNLIAAGPGAPVLTTLVSVDPMYASFNADEEAVSRALKSLGADAKNLTSQIDRIPVRMVTATSDETFEGRLQLIDNQVDAKNGTVRVRAVFGNKDGRLMPGQFARLSMGQANTRPALMVNERAIGTDQNKRFVMLIGADNKAEYREVTLGALIDGLRVVTNGLSSGDRIIVNGLQRVRPGAVIAPERVTMTDRPELRAENVTGTIKR
ncbi:efflux RND transporter periplasmic adaptor subunit [Rhodoplanes sp. Z2-YC6860]|uniref:efflux RND transporter periplasmic adaptor subunit n=1 Tax=Rhodoplanes sp. Z2-YC6860 TaxID=674703 RepID=UPI00078D0B0B|nr:efflux RND transporter periplasmic adaptor subunit [Rhodoplanes sp. Z2-YC6860]AMN42209.1 RND family efflux transporter MFP subunit [Rhodoplanes sp. Z2-YC6860]